MYTRISQSNYSDNQWDCFKEVWKGIRKGNQTNRDLDWFIDAHKDKMHEVHTMGSKTSLLFLPWHRQMLVSFERAGRKIESNFTIPFWNAAKRREIPDFLKKDLLGWMHSGARSFNRGYLEANTSQSNLQDILKEDDYAGFSLRLEQEYHDHVHVAVGGKMNSAGSPKDPLFWVHHAFVDKVWAEWQARNPGKGHPTPGVSLAPWNKDVSDVLETAELGYEYGSLAILS